MHVLTRIIILMAPLLANMLSECKDDHGWANAVPVTFGKSPILVVKNFFLSLLLITTRKQQVQLT